MFSDLEEAPTDTTPEKKKQKCSFTVRGHFGPKNLPLEEGQIPAAQLHLKGLGICAGQSAVGMLRVLQDWCRMVQNGLRSQNSP